MSLDDFANGLLVNKISWILMCIKFTLLKDREAVIKSLTHWIDSNLYRPITVLDVARKSGYSLAYIQRNFRQECGISIGLYIRSRKLEKAAHMLRHTGNDSNLLIVFYVQIMPDDFVMQLHRF